MSEDIVKRLRDQYDKCGVNAWSMCGQAADEIERLRAELAAEREAKQCAVDQAETFREERDALRSALEPFAIAAENFDTMPVKDPEGWFAYSGQSSFNKVVGAITVGDLRRARAALKG